MCAVLGVLCAFRGVVRGLACFRGCAFPLVMRSRLKFSLVLRFRGVGCVLVWVLVALRLVGRLNGFRLCAWLFVRELLRFGRDAWRDAERERERDGRREARREYPTPII